MNKNLHHILTARDLSPELLGSMIKRAKWMKETFHSLGGRDYLRKMYEGRVLLYTFGEPSTRTRISFCMAAFFLGMHVEGSDNAEEFSSKKKGESWEDMGRVMSGYQTDVMIARTKNAGDVEKIAAGSLCSVINGGDGDREHPTQMMVDIATIEGEFNTLEGLHIGVCGDLLRSRTVHSLVGKMSEFPGTQFTLFSPKELMLKPKLRQLLIDKRVPFTEHHELNPELMGGLQVFYQTRAQDERKGGTLSAPLVIGREELGWIGDGGILLHPLPVGPGGEISPEVMAQARLPRDQRESWAHGAMPFDQSDMGPWVRMAGLEYALGYLEA